MVIIQDSGYVVKWLNAKLSKQCEEIHEFKKCLMKQIAATAHKWC